MIHHLILLEEDLELSVSNGQLISGSNKLALEVLGSVQCFASRVRWSQTALEALARQCSVVMARWDSRTKKWATACVIPKARYVNPNALSDLCRLSERRAMQLASNLIFSKIENQHLMLRSFEPTLAALPRLRDNSFARILRLEAKYARFFWAKYFAAATNDLFAREKREAKHPLNVALNYGYGFLYHALEWQCLASGMDPTVGIIHKLRRSRPSLVCDLIEPFRCCVELTVMRHLNQMHEKKFMAGRFGEMIEGKWFYRGHQFRLRTIFRLTVESFARALQKKNEEFIPYRLNARDACL